MRRLRPLLALLLALLWLPAVLHCALEAAGVDPLQTECCADDHAATTGAGCDSDACATVEEALFKETSQVIKVAGPVACGCQLCLVALDATEAGARGAEIFVETVEPPAELAVGWQFAARAAPPARAPALNT